ELTPRAQAKLLRVLQDGEVRRLGENRTQRLDLRVVAATNRPFDAEGRFRRDLLYRLNVVALTAPPLSERGPDVAQLAEHCWKGVAKATGSRATLARETVVALAAHPWPGNVRELQNVLANLTVTGPRYGPVGPDALPSAFRRTVAAERRPTLGEAREDLERATVRDALGRHGSVARAAGELGVTRQGLSKLMARLQIDRCDPNPDRSLDGPSR
ncbi:MAG: sigma 54-interacting transcriptional regulator, partial [Acidobacteria bacterium]|nr:sigma 54-interacting transcriptional regulator [Acidobacteriota bacterium]